jgi:hypothetical protein
MALHRDCTHGHPLEQRRNHTLHNATCYEMKSATLISNFPQWNSPPIVPDSQIVGSPLETYLGIVILRDQIKEIVENQV